MAQLTKFFMHVPKCGGNGIVNIFEKLGNKVNTICDSNCKNSGSKANNDENINLAAKGGYVERIICQKAIDNTKSDQINWLIHHQFPREKKEGDYLIASIRHPYDMIVSRYFYHNRFYPNQITFEQWVDKYSGELLMRFIESCYDNGDVTGDMIIDKFIRLEDIESGITDLEGIINIDIPKGTTLKKLCGVKMNKTSHRPYMTYHTEETKAKVYKSCKLIFDMFGYKP